MIIQDHERGVPSAGRRRSRFFKVITHLIQDTFCRKNSFVKAGNFTSLLFFSLFRSLGTMSFDLLQKAMGVSYGSAYTRRSTTIPGMLLDPREIERLDDCSGHVMKRVAFAFGKQEENDDVQNDEIHLE